MFIKIEKWARETFEDQKVKYKDEMVITKFYFVLYIIKIMNNK